MLAGGAVGAPLDELTPREREVLAQLAEGKSNEGIAQALVVTSAAVEKACHQHLSEAEPRG